MQPCLWQALEVCKPLSVLCSHSRRMLGLFTVSQWEWELTVHAMTKYQMWIIKNIQAHLAHENDSRSEWNCICLSDMITLQQQGCFVFHLMLLTFNLFLTVSNVFCCGIIHNGGHVIGSVGFVCLSVRRIPVKLRGRLSQHSAEGWSVDQASFHYVLRKICSTKRKRASGLLSQELYEGLTEILNKMHHFTLLLS